MEPRKITARKPEMLTTRTARKVKFAAGGAAAGPPIGAAACELIHAVGLDVSTAVCLAAATLISSGLAWLLGYVARPDKRDQVKT